jgi:phosphocarrier protein HPr
MKGTTDGVLRREMIIRNSGGFHARPCALFVRTASRFEADIHVEFKDSTVSGKSIMGMMTLELGIGAVILVLAEGPDAKDALDALETLVNSRFYED